MILDLTQLGIASAYAGEITFLGETAGYRNTLGMYHIAPDGTISDVQIIFANASESGGGGDLTPGVSKVNVNFTAADSIGFFILPDGFGQDTASLLTQTNGHFEFRTATGAPASVNATSSPFLYYVDGAGRATLIHSVYYSTNNFHSAASADNNYALNGDNFNHVRFSLLIENGKALLKMAFEDLWNGGDQNYNDVVFTLDIGAVNTVALAPQVAPLIPKVLGTSDDAVQVAAKGIATVNLLANDPSASDPAVHITHLNGQAIAEGETITLSTGEKLTLGAHGKVTIEASANSGDAKVTYLTGNGKGVGVGVLTIHTAPVEGTNASDQLNVGYTDAHGHIIDGSDGLNDVIMGYGGDDKITAGLGHDNVYGGTGNDFMRAGDGNDLVYGGDGNDVLDGQSGADAMYGGAGDDVYYVDNAKDSVIEMANGGYDKVLSGLNHVLGSDVEELWLTEGSAALNGTGNTLNNKIVGNANANVLLGLEGADTLLGQAGDDKLDGGAGNDLIFGGLGNDLITGGDGADKLYGGTGSDTLQGGAGNDSLTADDGANLRLIGGTGADLLSGGAGVDVFVFAKGDGSDMVKNFQHGHDVLDFTGMTWEMLTIKAVGSSVQITDGFGDTVTLSNTAMAQVDHHDFIFA